MRELLLCDILITRAGDGRWPRYKAVPSVSGVWKLHLSMFQIQLASATARGGGAHFVKRVNYVTDVQKDFQIRTLMKRSFTKYQFFTKWPQILHSHQNRNSKV